MEPKRVSFPAATKDKPYGIAHITMAMITGSAMGPKFSDAVAGFFAAKQRYPDTALIGQSEHLYRMTFRLFEQFTYNPPVASIDRGVADAFLAAIERLPANWGKSKGARDKTLTEVLEQSANAETFISNKTVNRHISALSSLFKWLQHNKAKFELQGDNPFSNQWREEASIDAMQWLPYNIEELNKLFDGEPPSELRWIMLVALFTGMRLNEICQLHKEDLRREEGIWYLNVGNEYEGQRVKSETGFRRVPIHSELLTAGLVDYQQSLANGQRWPGLKPGGADRKLSWYVTRQFTAYCRKVGIKRARVNFHSLRKNFVTCLDNADGVSQADVAAIVGHERGFTLDRYSEGRGLPGLQQIVEQVKYTGLRLSHRYAS